MLTSLQDLCICFHCSDVDVLRHAILLTNLTRLHVSDQSGEDYSVMNISMPWCKLHALRDLAILNFRLQLGVEVAELLQLPHLRQVSFVDSIASGEYDVSVLLR